MSFTDRGGALYFHLILSLAISPSYYSSLTPNLFIIHSNVFINPCLPFTLPAFYVVLFYVTAPFFGSCRTLESTLLFPSSLSIKKHRSLLRRVVPTWSCATLPPPGTVLLPRAVLCLSPSGVVLRPSPSGVVLPPPGTVLHLEAVLPPWSCIVPPGAVLCLPSFWRCAPPLGEALIVAM